jgi:hypothetical protein
MSEFVAPTPVKPKANWADDASDEEEEEELENEILQEDEDSESDESSEEEEEQRRAVTVTKAQQPIEKKVIQVAQLSKKERKDLRLKELNDLDSILNEYNKDIIIPASSLSLEEKKEIVKEPTDKTEIDNEKLKKKKKKKAVSTNAKVSEEEVSTNPSTEIKTIETVDVAALLKAKLTKKKTSSSSASSLAIAEALKAAEEANKKKGKKDKSKKGYNETSY